MTDTHGALFEFGPGLVLDLRGRSLVRDGLPLPLPPKAFDVLAVLVEAEGRLVTHEELRQRVWGDWKAETFNANQLHFQLTKIRELLKPHLDGQACIQAVPRQGFRLALQVRRAGEPARASADALIRTPAGEASPTPAETQARRVVVTSRGRGVAIGAAIALIAVAGIAAALWLLAPGGQLRVVSFTPLTHDRAPKSADRVFVDATRVYYESERLGELYAVPQSGGEPSPVLPSTSAFAVVDVKPDGTAYLAVRVVPSASPAPGGDLWTLPSAPGTPTRMGDLRCDSAAWSPDERRIACAHESTLLLADQDGASPRALARLAKGVVRRPRWSPDGTRVRFTVETAVDRGRSALALWEVAANGTGLRRLVPGWGTLTDACCGTWSPDGDYFVFQAWTDGRTDLWAMGERSSWWEDTPQPFRLTAGPMDFAGPLFSRDGATVFAAGSHITGELMRFDVERRQFFPYLRGISGTWLTFSPDGRSVAYIGYPDRQVWRARADGTGRQALTSGPFDNDTAALSPDGSRIAFRSRREGRHLRIFLMPAEGGEPTPITAEDREQGTPTWAPDGTRLAYGDVPAVFGRPDGGERIHVYELATRRVVDLPGSAGLWTARWSPDARYLAATRITDRRLHIFDFSTTTWRELPADHVEQFTWSRDAAFILFHTEGVEHRLRRLTVSDGHVEDLADLRELRLVSGAWSGLTPDGAPIMLRDLGDTELYALSVERR